MMRQQPSIIALVPLVLVIATTSLIVGCATVNRGQGESLIPTRFNTRVGPFEVATNFPLNSTDPVLKGLKSLSQEVENSLGVSIDGGDNPVKVNVLSDKAAFAYFMTINYPQLPQRRAFFLSNSQNRVVYTYNGDHLAVDLRHEATHALLSLAVGDLPIWLDEGLAEYFEVPTESHGFNQEHFQKLVHEKNEGWEPDLVRLESLASVRDLDPRDYRESWLWVHSLLNGSSASRSALMEYLVDRRQSVRTSAPLSDYLAGNHLDDPNRLLAHLDGAEAKSLALLSSSRGTTVRFQSPNAEPQRTPRPKRGFFASLGRLFFGQEPETHP